MFTTLNPMVFNSRFQHITEKIFKNLDIKTLKNTRLVSKSWQEYMDNQKVLWKNVNGTKVFQLACEKGHTRMAEILIQNSLKFNIDLNVKYGYFEKTAFLTACHYGCSEVVEMIVKKSTELIGFVVEYEFQMIKVQKCRKVYSICNDR